MVIKQAKDDYVKKVIDIADRHMKKYGRKSMTLEELDKLFEA